VEVVAEPANLVDGVWGDARPAPPAAPLRVHPLEYAGESVQDKLASVRTAMQAKGAAVMIISTLDQVK
jgi:Xaa-Pro aminopeptidase